MPVIASFRLGAFLVPFHLATLTLPAATPAQSGGGELVLHKWSGDLNVPDPVACAVDPQGRVYVTATTRRKVADLDIRENTDWIPDDVALDSVEAKRAFYRRELAPGRLLRPRGSLADHNQDGSIDYHDLTVHTERIYQLRDTDGDGTADKMTVFAEGFNSDVTGIAAGVLWHDGWLYATIAPDLWRLKDVDDDGVADIREVVVHGFGFHIAYAGHDMHGLSVGPDGRIYWSIGDKGANVTSREGRHFYYPNEGAVFRIEPDGSGFEVYAHGLRNPQEPAFDAWGNLFVVDNDADMEGERERFVYIAEGSDSGWRCNYQYMGMASPWMREGLWQPQFEGQPAYLLPPIANYADGPAGFRFEPGTALGPDQRSHFLLTEFPAGRIRGFRVEPEGASFRMVGERVLNTGVMGIGLDWHADGSLMMADWIGGYPLDELGAVWKVDSVKRDEAERKATYDLLRGNFDEAAETDLLHWLAHADQRVRQQAQFALVRRNEAAELLQVAQRDEAPLLARVHALWGYGQLLRKGVVEDAPIRSLLGHAEAEIRAQTAKVLGDASPEGATVRALIEALRDAKPRVRFHVAVALSKAAAPEALQALRSACAEDGHDPVLRSALVGALARNASAEWLVQRTSDESIWVRMASVLALRRQRSAEVAAFLNDSDSRVSSEAARAIHDEVALPAALPKLAAMLPREGLPEMMRRRVINANLRLGTPVAASRLLEYALTPAEPLEMREEALIALRTWPEPPRLDRVDGWARSIQTEPVGDVLLPKLGVLLDLPEPELRSLAIETMIAHRLNPQPEQLARAFADEAASGELRAQLLRLTARASPGSATLHAMQTGALAAEAQDALFTVAMELLAQQEPTAFAAAARQALGSRGIGVQQRIISLISGLDTRVADPLLEQLAADLLGGKLVPALHRDVLEVLEQRSAKTRRWARVVEQYAASADGQAHRDLLAGGDSTAGRELALNHLAANCLACHRIESNQGSQVGPPLTKIGRTRSPESLLRSLIEPGAELSPGYGFVSVTLASGESVHGGLVEESAAEVVVRPIDGSVHRVPRNQITEMTPPMSIMPPMAGILSPRELRDLVAYLQTLGREKPPK